MRVTGLRGRETDLGHTFGLTEESLLGVTSVIREHAANSSGQKVPPMKVRLSMASLTFAGDYKNSVRHG
jgi:hypothetical protein